MTEPIHIISLGAGVQSSTMALMAAAGEIGPMPSCAIFADTQAEPKSVYVWLDWLEKQLPFPVYRVTSGNLVEISTTERISKKTGLGYFPFQLPVFTKNLDGTNGMMRRQCTDKSKLAPLRKAINKQRQRGEAIVWIGISLDESLRMKNSNHSKIKHIWPLIDLNMTRASCKAWMESRGHPEPPRSACSMCPYHSNQEWIRLKTHEPEAFSDAVQYESRIQESFRGNSRLTSVPFLHESRQPLSEVDFSVQPEKQPDLFTNECSGLCGI